LFAGCIPGANAASLAISNVDGFGVEGVAMSSSASAGAVATTRNTSASRVDMGLTIDDQVPTSRIELSFIAFCHDASQNRDDASTVLTGDTGNEPGNRRKVQPYSTRPIRPSSSFWPSLSQMLLTMPLMLAIGTAPQILESFELSRLSPITNTWSAGTT